MLKKGKLAIGLIISAFFLYLTLKGINWKFVVTSLTTAEYWLLIPAIILHFISFYLRALKWGILTDKFAKISRKELFHIVCIGLSMNNILPLRAGEFARIFILARKYGLSAVNATLSLISERVFDMIGLLIVVVLFAHFHTWPRSVSSWINIISILLLVFIFCTPIFLQIAKMILQRYLTHTWPAKQIMLALQMKVQEVYTGYMTYKDIPIILRSMGLSTLLWIIEGISYFVMATMFHIHISLPNIIFLCALINISSLVPSTSGFIGTFEFFATSLLTLLGVAKPLALAYTLVLHAELLVPVTLVGLYFYFGKKYYTYISFKQIESEKIS